MAADFELWCPNCRAPVPIELKRELAAGKPATCESCGILIVPRFQGDAHGSDDGIREERVEIPREPAHVHGTPPYTSSPAPVSSTKPAPPPAPAAFPAWASLRGRAQGGETRHARDTPAGPDATGITLVKQGEPQVPEAEAESIKRDLERGRVLLLSYNEVSHALVGLFSGIFVLVSLLVIALDAFAFRSPADPAWFVQQVSMLGPLYVLAIFMTWYEKARLYPWLKEGIHEFYGIDIVVVGFAGLAVCGIGLLLVIKGFMVMAMMAGRDKLDPPGTHEARIAWIDGLDEVSWMVVAVASINALLMIPLAIARAGFAVSMPEPLLVGGLVLGIIGIMAAHGDARHVSPKLKARQYRGLAAKAWINAVLGLACMGSGVPLLVKAILLSSSNEAALEAAALRAARTAALSRPASSEPREPAIVVPGPVMALAPAALPDHHAAAPAPVRPSPAPAAPAAGPGMPAGPPPARPPRDPVDDDPAVRKYLQRQFNVLTPKVRRKLARLERLGIPGEDMDEIVEELVHHPEFEQLAIIDQYVSLNAAGGIDARHVLAVRAMNLPDDATRWMLAQVQQMPDNEIDGFLESMKRATQAP